MKLLYVVMTRCKLRICVVFGYKQGSFYCYCCCVTRGYAEY